MALTSLDLLRREYHIEEDGLLSKETPEIKTDTDYNKLFVETSFGSKGQDTYFKPRSVFVNTDVGGQDIYN